MKLYTCTKFKGHYPVGVSAIVWAESQNEAARELALQLVQAGLPQVVWAETMIEVELDSTVPKAIILNNGDY